MKAIYDAGVKEISRNGVDEKDGFICLPMSRTLWGRNFSTMVTGLSAGYA